LISLTSH